MIIPYTFDGNPLVYLKKIPGNPFVLVETSYVDCKSESPSVLRPISLCYYATVSGASASSMLIRDHFMFKS